MAKLDYVEGIGPKLQERLESVGVKNTQDLLEQGATSTGRKALAEKLKSDEDRDISEKMILEWVNRCDLARITGVGSEYADLLENAGVDTVPELATRNSENLHAKLVEVNEEKNLVRSLPSANQVSDWINEAKTLPRVISY